MPGSGMTLNLAGSGPQLTIQALLNQFEPYSDQRTQGYDGPSRNVRLSRVTPAGGGSVAKSDDGQRCVVTGKESLRILRVSDASQTGSGDHKSASGKGGHRIDASRNFWEGSGLKIDSASTDVAWGHGAFSNKILTSARNGELIMWDLHNKSATTKYERRTKDHLRSIHKMSLSHVVHHYCITASADGHLRVWDLRDLTKSIMRVHHPTSVRSVVFSPSLWQPLQAVAGLDNGSIYRWDLKMGQRGQLDRLAVAHTASVTTVDWCSSGGLSHATSAATPLPIQTETSGNGLGWILSGGLDKTVKVWDLTAPGNHTHIPHKPTYTLHPSFAVRRVAWRPGYECELAIVSNAEYGTAASDVIPSASGSGLVTRVGSAVALDSLMRGPSLETMHGKNKSSSQGAHEKVQNGVPSVGDAIEIWDVRRAWIAKWSVTGSATEGGVTDIIFNDSHAIWSQHTSGAFSQFDLRECTKPLDAIPRAAATWEATGSIAFAVDKKERWEMPYDDLKPDTKPSSLDSKKANKALGDPPGRAVTQVTAAYAYEFAGIDIETFTALARNYIFEGRERKAICAFNSGVALSAGHESAAQLWLLLGAAISKYIPEFPPTPPASPPPKVGKTASPSLYQDSPQPPTASSGYTFPPARGDSTPSTHRISPGRRSTTGSGSLTRINSASSSRRLTPTSSASSSPRHMPVGLPVMTPRRASFFTGRRESTDSGVFGRSALLRRPSIPLTMVANLGGPNHSFTHSASASPSDKGTPSLRHVGEGTLDDSDSSSGGSDDDGEQTAGVISSDEESGLKSLISPVLANPGSGPSSSQRNGGPAPSPLSRVAGRQSWSGNDEDEEDEVSHSSHLGQGHKRQRRGDNDDDEDEDDSSPSPQSTSDTDSDGSSSPDKIRSRNRARSQSLTHGKGFRRVSVGRASAAKSRSRSSTVASLAASAVPTPQSSAQAQSTGGLHAPSLSTGGRPLMHHGSHSSIKTVTAGEGGGNEGEDSLEHYTYPPRPSQPLAHNARQLSAEFKSGHNRNKSQAVSEFLLGSSKGGHDLSMDPQIDEVEEEEEGEDEGVDDQRMTDRHIDIIESEDKRFRETTLEALKVALEEYADSGDVQMCAMLALVASDELSISRSRRTRFLDSYIELLTRLRLHTCAAYLRKFTEVEEIKSMTLLETTIYTSCGRCRKSIALPVGSSQAAELNRGRFAYCTNCNLSPIKCSICRLPVRTLLFQCSICHHGGHQLCYREYYMARHMVDLPTTFLPAPNDPRGRSSLRGSSGNTGIDDEAGSVLSMQSSTSTIDTATTGTGTPNTESPVQHGRGAKLAGHPCAAGCGHFCWAANRDVEEL